MNKMKRGKHFKVVASDLTYVKVGSKWDYTCVIVDLFNREIIGAVQGKTRMQILKKAFVSIKANLGDIRVFHTDRGSEFKNNLIDVSLEASNISRLLSKKEGEKCDKKVIIYKWF